MSFDQNALDSLRIERTAGADDKRFEQRYKWFLAAVLAIAAIAGAYALLRDKRWRSKRPPPSRPVHAAAAGRPC